MWTLKHTLSRAAGMSCCLNTYRYQIHVFDTAMKQTRQTCIKRSRSFYNARLMSPFSMGLGVKLVGTRRIVVGSSAHYFTAGHCSSDLGLWVGSKDTLDSRTTSFNLECAVSPHRILKPRTTSTCFAFLNNGHVFPRPNPQYPITQAQNLQLLILGPELERT